MTQLRNKFWNFLHEVSKEEGGEDYNTLAICIRSGQVSSQQVMEHMKDKRFKEFYTKVFLQYLKEYD